MKKLYALILVISLLIISGCSPSLKDMTLQYQKESTPILAEFDKIQAEYTELAKKTRGNTSDDEVKIRNNFLEGMQELEERTVKAKNQLADLKIPTELRSVNEAGIKVMTSYETFLREVRIAYVTFDFVKMGNASKVKAEAEEQYRKYKNMVKDALDGKKPQ